MKNLILTLVLFGTMTANAQYADMGTGTFKNELYWFDWAGFTIANNATRTFNTADGLAVTITFTNVSATVPPPSIMNTWRGAVLHFLYDFSNPAIRPAFYSISTPTSHQFTMHITATRGGAAAPFQFVAADAEASDDKEVTTLSTTGSSWQTMEFFRNSPVITNNPLTGCGTSNVSISETYGGSSGIGQNPVVITRSPLSGVLDVTVGINRINVSGGLGVAFALFAPIDCGDLPASYGFAQHQLTYINNNPCNYLPPLPTMTRATNLMIGSVAGDADPGPTTNDNLNGTDEEGVTAFPAYTGGGSYTLPVNFTNTTSNTAYLTGWFDYNHDGQFSNNESVTQPVSATSTANLTWTGLPAVLPRGTGQAFRFRLTTDQTTIQNAGGFAPDGEVEDYWVPCSLTINTTSDTAVCAGRPVPISTTGALTYTWNISMGLSNATIGNPVASPTSTTKYIVEGNDYRGCYAKDSITISVLAPPVLIKSADTTICNNGTASLTVNGALQYNWSPAVTVLSPSGNQVTVSPLTTTKYYVTAQGANGCERLDSILVSIRPLPIFAVQPNTAVNCQGTPITLTASGGNTYAWIDNNAVWATTPSISVQPTTYTIYKVGITDNTCNYTDTLTVPVTVNDLPIATVTAGSVINCSNDKSRLQVTSNRPDDTYTWDPAPGITDLRSASPTVTPLKTTRYYVTITNKEGCAKRDSVDVLVEFEYSKSTFSMANVFTPNSDRHNDCFGLKYWGVVKQLDFSIYNRWGGLVFHTTNPGDCWDGKFQGKEQSSGAFVYLIKAVTACGVVSRKGVVTLVR